MFLNKNSAFKEIPSIIGIIIYAFYVNWFSANMGIIPIDSFGFLDPGFSILKNKLPIRDFWIFTGLLVDYMGAFFFWIFGNNWNSHLIHAGFMNILGSLGFYFFLNKIKLNKKYALIYTLSFATLCYPVSGTPFAYLHSFIFSLLAIFVLLLGLITNKKNYWLLLPIICFLSFLSMQTPAAYIIILILSFSVYYFIKDIRTENFKYFLFSGIFCSIVFLSYLLLSKTPISNFIYQYILFPMTIGEGRITNNELAYVSLIDQLNFKRIFGNFKFIHFFLLPLILILIKSWKKKDNYNILNLLIILSTIIFIFNQLLTANQIYIFSLIPILAAVLHINILRAKHSQKYIMIILLIVLFATIKFHVRYNVDRKFHDLENIDKSKAVPAKIIHKNLNNLMWITKLVSDPKEEAETIKKAISVIEKDNRKKILITHYQFISTVLDTDLNILNRWYLWDNNTHPTEGHKYFQIYKDMVNRNVKKNNIKVIYLLGQKNEILLDDVKNYFTDVCFESKTLEKNKFSVHKIIDCKLK